MSINFGSPFNLPNHPVVGVTWYEVLAFSRWLARRWLDSGLLAAGWQVFLPSEAQWEKAARGGEQMPEHVMIERIGSVVAMSQDEIEWVDNPTPLRLYPWGQEFSANNYNVSETRIGRTSAVGCFPAGASPYGVIDMSGNVWEWTRSLKEEYPYPDVGGEKEKREDLQASGGRVLRGGSFGNYCRFARCACRDNLYPDSGINNLGFRVALSPA